MIKPIILSGGSGSRLWPLSRRLTPKQFLPLTGEHGLLATTALRAAGVPGCLDPVVVCNVDHRYQVMEQMEEVGIEPEAVILEPVGRNTAPAVAAAALHCLARDPEATLLVLPADHFVADPGAFVRAVTAAVPGAESGRLITFGITPTWPATGFGYIRAGSGGDEASRPIVEFIEKPERASASALVASGDCFWNSGIFLMRAETYLRELRRLAPSILAAVTKAIDLGRMEGNFQFLDEQTFTACPADSIDYVVMEHTDLGMVVPLACGWNDIGTWPALWGASSHDERGNSLRGDVDVRDSRDSLVWGTSRHVAVLGLTDAVVVETADAVLVADKGHAQGVKALVEGLREAGRPEAEHHTRVERPWGSFESLLKVDGFQVKRIIVRPGRRLSLQLHHRRQEHWVVVRGQAEVVCGEKVSVLGVDQSVYIPVRTKHRLGNPGTDLLEIIEVQIGDYLGEDDIERFEDEYGRC